MILLAPQHPPDYDLLWALRQLRPEWVEHSWLEELYQLYILEDPVRANQDGLEPHQRLKMAHRTLLQVLTPQQKWSFATDCAWSVAPSCPDEPQWAMVMKMLHCAQRRKQTQDWTDCEQDQIKTQDLERNYKTSAAYSIAAAAWFALSAPSLHAAAAALTRAEYARIFRKGSIPGQARNALYTEVRSETTQLLLPYVTISFP